MLKSKQPKVNLTYFFRSAVAMSENPKPGSAELTLPPRAVGTGGASRRRCAAVRARRSLIATAIAGAIVGAVTTPVAAVSVLLQADDPVGASSFTGTVRWNPAIAPNAADDYFTQGFRLRTPDSAPTASFAGGSLTVQSGGSLAMKAANAGTVTVDNLTMSAGSTLVQFNAGFSTLSGDGISLTGVATFDGRAAGRTLIVAPNISGIGGINVVTSLAGDPGVILLTGANTYTGATTVDASGFLVTGAAGALSSSSDMTVNGILRLSGDDNAVASLSGGGRVENNAAARTAELTIAGASVGTFSGELSDGVAGSQALSVVKTGSETQTFSSANTYTGGTSIEGGTLKITDGGALGTGSVAIDGGTLELDPVTFDNDLDLTGYADATTAHVNATDAGNVINGNVTLNDGGNFNLAATGSGSTLTINGTITDTGSNGDELNFNVDTGATITVANAVTLDDGTDAINKTGGGTLETSGNGNSGTLAADTLNIDDGTVDLGAALSTSGDVTVGDGTGADDSAVLTQTGGSFFDRTQQLGSVVVDSDGQVDLNGSAGSMNALNGSGEVTNGGAAQTLTLGNASIAGDFSGEITGDLGLTKVDGNTQTLSGDSSYTGATDVQGGTLNVQSATALGSAASGTTVSGATSKVEFQGAIVDMAEAFDLIGRADTAVHLDNVADSNSILGAVTLSDSTDSAADDDMFTITSSAGVLSLASVTGDGEAGDAMTLNLGGASTGANTVTALTLNSGAENNLTKKDDGTWSVGNLTLSDGTITTESGTLSLTGDANLTGSLTYDVMKDSTLDVSGLTSTLTLDGDTLSGAGTINGDVIAASGSTIDVGDGTGAGEMLTFGDNLTLDGASSLALDVSGGLIDALLVEGDLSLVDATLDITGTLTAVMYDVVTYVGTLLGTFSNDIAGYSFDYSVDGTISLVSNDTPIPTPGPVALIGLGAFLLARQVRKARR
jgi:fibronectin-binding autotransporter adhesin